jgi:hypothetical protein
MGRYLLRLAFKRATKKGLPATIDVWWMMEKLQANVCEVTGIELELGGAPYAAFSPSIDRIDPDLGYTKKNTRLVCLIYNSAKHVNTDKDVLKMAKALIKRNEC